MTGGPFGLGGRHALVTGASGGLGSACAAALAEAGAGRLTLAARRRAPLDAAATAVRSRAPEVEVAAHACDTTSATELAALFASVDPPDVVVSATGANVPQPFLEADEPTFDALVAVNLKGTFLVFQQAARALVRAGSPGVLVALGSQMGHVGDARRTVYCATKHAVEGLVKAAAVELAAHGIRVLSVAPTFVRTPMTEAFLRDEEFHRSVLDRIPVGRLASAEDVARAVVYAASPAAAMVTGTSLLVDGGWTAR